MYVTDHYNGHPQCHYAREITPQPIPLTSWVLDQNPPSQYPQLSAIPCSQQSWNLHGCKKLRCAAVSWSATIVILDIYEWNTSKLHHERERHRWWREELRHRLGACLEDSRNKPVNLSERGLAPETARPFVKSCVKTSRTATYVPGASIRIAAFAYMGDTPSKDISNAFFLQSTPESNYQEEGYLKYELRRLSQRRWRLCIISTGLAGWAIPAGEETSNSQLGCQD